MMRIFKSDLYRLFHTTGFWLTLAVTLIAAVVSAANKAIGGITMGTSALENMAAPNWTVYNTARYLSFSTTYLPYVFIGLFVILIGYEFSQQTYKNTLTAGIGRWQFIISKNLTLLLTVGVLIALFFFSGVLTSAIAGRPMGAALGKIISRILLYTGSQLVGIAAVYALATVLLVLFHSTVIAAVFIVVFPLFVPGLNTFVHWSWLKYIDFLSTSQNLTAGILSNQTLGRFILVSVLTTIIAWLASALILKNQEL
ncbi:ABC transporter permease [Schleiferilactobacillus harbinensis]|uniref:ABC transporter permease n=1 Tax=Schleiferilactobacillus harbinensis TaxID=304207 RepID=UPI0007B7E9C7|nr:ABC transporter permease [Schleiferilactobacillus harbinensis]MCT2909313.1 ABC transporter permease [Schleiferilactobacillus harbinensis]HAY53681.1 ABC transporter permease [Lactobacillus sp.]